MERRKARAVLNVELVDEAIAQGPVLGVLGGSALSALLLRKLAANLERLRSYGTGARQ